MFIDLPEEQDLIAKLIAEHRWDDAVANVVVAVHNTYRSEQFQCGYLHYPGLDRCVEQLALVAARSTAEGTASAPHTATEKSMGGNLIIATELYAVGGHTRVVGDLLRLLPEPTLVLTDLFGNYRKAPDQLNWVHDENPNAAVLPLYHRTLWGKCLELARLVRRLAPRNIVYLQHHQDPLAFIGTQGYGPARKTLVHHCDNNASLGGTLTGIAHVDFTEELALECARVLQRPTQVLPLHVADRGCKAFEPLAGTASFSVVTSGTQIKFAQTGPIALHAIAQTVLSATRGRFFHIGPLDTSWLAQILQHLAAQGLDATRFVALGNVASLWATLKQLDAHLYLGSAPVGGGRATIEAQGCGYPVAFYRSDLSGNTSLRVESLYASRCLSWTNLSELSILLQGYPSHQASLSLAARQFYEAGYSQTAFMRELQRMLEAA